MHNLRQSKIIHQHSKSQKTSKEIGAGFNGKPAKSSKKNGTNTNFIDIYAEDEDFQVTGDMIMDAEAGYDAVFQRIEAELLSQLQSCMVCNPVPKKDKKLCLLTKYGQHGALGMVQIREWVEALVVKENPVSLLFFLIQIIHSDQLKWKYSYAHENVDLTKVTFKMPPDIPCFHELLNPRLPGKIVQSLPIRSNRREVASDKLVPVAPALMPQIHVAPQIILPPMNHQFQTPTSRYKYNDALSFSPGDIAYPTVDEWLLSLGQAEMGRCDLQSIRNTFEVEGFSEFTIDVLEDYKISSLGPSGSGVFKQAEEALLSFKLKKTITQLRKEAAQAKGQ
ncbi:MAG TPA: hypothetical protein VGO47_10805 [Chlamydiales bacterium]|nr:hypothetical protein [Chlamydiales bacterium]